MSDSSLFASLRAEYARLHDELRGLVVARWRLAELETRVAAAQLRRCAIGVAVGLLLLFVALPVGVVAVADWAAQLAGWSRVATLSAASALLAIIGLLLAIGTLWHFRRQFVGWQDSLAELHEDLVWCREWLGQEAPADATADDASTPASTEPAPYSDLSGE